MTTQPAPTKIVSALCLSLDEPLFSNAHRQISIVVQIIGGPAAQDLAQRAKTAHQGQGMMTLDSKQRRTLGGIFFHQFKTSASPEPTATDTINRSLLQQPRSHRSHKLKPVGARTTAPAVPVVSKNPVAPVKAGQAEGKRKPMEPAVNHRKSGKLANI